MQDLFYFLIQISIISSLLIIFVLLINKLMASKINIKFIILLWIIVLLRLLIPVFFDTEISLYSMMPGKAEELISKVFENKPSDEVINSDIQMIENTITNSNSDEILQLKNNTLLRLKMINVYSVIILMWCAGALFFILKKIYSGYKFTKIIKTDEYKEMNAILIECKDKLKYYKKINIKKSKYLTVPITYGVFTPSIVLPYNLSSKISESKIKLIILHELSHIKRKDILRNYIWLIAKAIHWFNPLVYIAYSKYLLNVEQACDQTVISNIPKEQKYEYSQTLLDVVKIAGLSKQHKIPSTVAFCESATNIGRRLDKMHNYKRQIKSAGVFTLMFAIIIVFLSFTTACLPVKESINTNDNINELMDENQNYYTIVSNADDFYVIEEYSYSYDNTSGIVITTGTKAEKDAVDAAKQVITSADNNISKSDLKLYEINRSATDESTYTVTFGTKNAIAYIVNIDMATGTTKSIASAPSNSITLTDEMMKDALESLELNFKILSADEAKEKAKEILLNQVNFTDKDSVENLSCDFSSYAEYQNMPIYLVRYKYTPSDTKDEINTFVALIYIDAYTGEKIKVNIYEE